MSKNIVLFSKIWPIDELKCLTCSFSLNEKNGKKTPSQFHQRILKCRIMIFTIPQILASPNPHHKFEILLVYNENITDELKLREELIKNKINVLKKSYVTPSMLELCFKYTLEAKISPFWNMVDNVFVKGRNFLLESAPLDAVCVNVYVTDDTLRLELKCYKIMLKQFDIKDLEISSNVIDYFLNVFDAKLSENSLCEQWVHVLPRLTKARIISVNRKMPISPHFNDYKELRRHWKNIYGYRLPDHENDLLFYEIHFRPFGSELYTYPSICLRSHLPLKNIPSPSHTNDIIHTFLKDIKSQFPAVFGLPIDLNYNDPLLTIVPYSNIYGIFNPLLISPITTPKKIMNDENNNHSSETKLLTQNISLCTPSQVLSEISDNIRNNNKYYPIFRPKNNIKSIQYTPEQFKCSDDVQEKFSIENKENNTESVQKKDTFISSDQKTLFVPKFISKKPLNTSNFETKAIKYSPIFENKTVLNKISEESQSYLSELSKISNQSFSQIDIGSQRRDEIELGLSQNKSKIFNHFKSTKNANHANKDMIVNNKSTTTIKNSQQENISQGEKNPRKRKRPEVDQSKINDVPILARNEPDKLKNINRDTIAAWLKSQKIYVTTKMTKQQLLDKLSEAINKN